MFVFYFSSGLTAHMTAHQVSSSIIIHIVTPSVMKSLILRAKLMTDSIFLIILFIIVFRFHESDPNHNKLCCREQIAINACPKSRENVMFTTK